MAAVWVGMAFGSRYLEKVLPPGLNIGTLVGLFFIGLAIYHRWRLRRDELQARWQLRFCAGGLCPTGVSRAGTAAPVGAGRVRGGQN